MVTAAVLLCVVGVQRRRVFETVLSVQLINCDKLIFVMYIECESIVMPVNDQQVRTISVDGIIS